jgi:hypothetical protein
MPTAADAEFIPAARIHPLSERRSMDFTGLSEDEDAMIVALRQGHSPRGEDPIAKALEARGIARRTQDGSWELTPAGSDHLADLSPG